MNGAMYLVRHTSVAVGPTMCYGRSDVALAESWREEFEDVVSKLSLEQLDGARIYSSPLTRCALLAEHLANQGLRSPEHDARLQEMNFGRWELNPWSELPATEISTWRRNVVDSPAPGGESFGEVASRASAFFEDARTALDRHGCIVICHGGVIRALLAHVIGCTLEQALKLQVDYGGITRLELGTTQHRIAYVNR